MFAYLGDLLISWIHSWGYLGLFLASFLENLIPPIPSEVIMPLGGYLASIGSISVIGAILTCTVGSALGTVPYYYLGKYLHRERLTLLVQKYGHWIGYKTEYLDDLYETFATHGPSIVFSSRFIPGARSIISLPAGSAGMPLGQLMIYSIAGGLIWTTILVLIGYYLGAQYTSIIPYVSRYDHLLLPLAAIIIGGWLIWRMYKRSRAPQPTK